MAQERDQTRAAIRIEFSHDVIDEEDRRGPVHSGEVLRLSDLQGDGERALGKYLRSK